MYFRFLLSVLFLLLAFRCHGADDINTIPSVRCGDLLMKIGVRGVNPLYLVYREDIDQPIEVAIRNIEAVESECREISEVLIGTKASLLLRAGKKAQAKKTMGSLVERKPESWTVMQSAGLFYDAIGEYGQAVSFLEKAKKIDSDWTINAALAAVYYRAGRNEDAVNAYRTAVRLNSRAANMKEAKESYLAACKSLRNHPLCP